MNKRYYTKILREEQRICQERGEAVAFLTDPLWFPEVLSWAVFLGAGRAGPLPRPGPGAFTRGDDREEQSGAASQSPGPEPQATL